MIAQFLCQFLMLICVVCPSALLYVKLLMLTGVAELVIEGSTWALGRRRLLGEFAEHVIVQSVENATIFAITLTFLDLIRAVSVFWLCCGPLFRRTRLWQAVNRRLATGWRRVRAYFRSHSHTDAIEMSVLQTPQ